MGSCHLFCEDCGQPCLDGCIEGDCRISYQGLQPPRNTEPVHWATFAVVGGCPDVTDDQGQVTRIECRNEDGALTSFVEVFYEDNVPVRADAHAFPASLETVSQSYEFENVNGQVSLARLHHLGEVPWVAVFSYDGELTSEVDLVSVGDIRTVTTYGYDPSGAVILEDAVTTDPRPVDGDDSRYRSTWDGNGRPQTLETFDSGPGPLLGLERYVYEGEDPLSPPVRHEYDDGGDGELDAVVEFIYDESGTLVGAREDRAPLGSVDAEYAISENCCLAFCEQ